MFLPYQPDKPGGTPVGSSYLKAYISCPRRWFYTYVWPWLEGGRVVARGLVREDAPQDQALNIGSLFHSGMEAYLVSGCKDGADTGEYDLEAALATLELAKPPKDERQQVYFKESLLEVKSMLINYDRHAGPKGINPAFPTLRVACDPEGKPLVERAYWTPLGYRDYVFTCQVDAIVIELGVNLKVLEHKTSAPGMWVTRRLKTLGTDAQITGEIFTLANQFPQEDTGWKYLDGVRMQVFTKGWKPGSRSSPAPFQYSESRRTPKDLDSFRVRVVGLLQQIDDRTSQFESELAKGTDMDLLVQNLFPNTGFHTDACWDYGRECNYMDLCRVGQTDGVLRGYKPRASVETVMFEGEEQ